MARSFPSSLITAQPGEGEERFVSCEGTAGQQTGITEAPLWARFPGVPKGRLSENLLDAVRVCAGLCFVDTHL